MILAKNIWFGVLILANIIIYIYNIYWIGDLNLYNIYIDFLGILDLFNDLLLLLFDIFISIYDIYWIEGPKYSLDIVYNNFLVT